jgi:hypothetical protein
LPLDYCEKLKKENAVLRTELGTIEALRQENETLKENALLRTELEIIEELRKENDNLKYKLLALESNYCFYIVWRRHYN